MQGPGEPQVDASPSVPLALIAREWGRIGITGFGGPPAHIALLRRLCVQRNSWLTEAEFEDGIAATSLLPGPASTQLAIFCGWRLAGPLGAIVGRYLLHRSRPGHHPWPVGAVPRALAARLGHRCRGWGRIGGAGGRGRRGAGSGARELAQGWGGDPRRVFAGSATWLAGGVAANLVGEFLVVVLLACGLVGVAGQPPAGQPAVSPERTRR